MELLLLWKQMEEFTIQMGGKTINNLILKLSSIIWVNDSEGEKLAVQGDWAKDQE